MPFVTTYVKPEYPPLLSLGWHIITLEELRVRCVDAFPLSDSRELIMCCLEHIVGVLRAAGIRGRLWVDGSYLTQKIDPDDSDIVLCMDGSFADSMSPAQSIVVDWISAANPDLHRWLKCHSFAIARWPEGHPSHESGEWMYAYWLRQWGFSQSDTPKGIAVIEL